MNGGTPLQVEASEAAAVAPQDSSVPGSVNIVLAVPETITVRLVDANTVDAAEEWAVALGIVSSFFSGFAVAAITEAKSPGPVFGVIVAVTLMLLVATIYCGWKTKVKRAAFKATEMVHHPFGARQRP